MRLRAIYAAISVLLVALIAASPALAQNGEGLIGATDDKIVTFVSLGVVCFFPLFVFAATVLQSKLEKRKEQKKAAALRQRIGW